LFILPTQMQQLGSLLSPSENHDTLVVSISNYACIYNIGPVYPKMPTSPVFGMQLLNQQLGTPMCIEAVKASGILRPQPLKCIEC